MNVSIKRGGNDLANNTASEQSGEVSHTRPRTYESSSEKLHQKRELPSPSFCHSLEDVSVICEVAVPWAG